MANQKGLEWVKGKLDQLEPRWTTQPNIKAIEILARKHLNIEANAPCKVTFFTQGAFNKLYKIETADRASIMRVSLPLDPHNKTQSEVATIDFVRQNTDIPTAEVYAHDASNDNELGLEWILMEILPGSPLGSRWRTLSMEKKFALVRTMARYQAQLFRLRFSGIGNIFQTENEVADGGGAEVGRIVSMFFCWGDHLTWDVPRGPFRSSYDWLHARLHFIIEDQVRILEVSKRDDQISNAEETRAVAERLLNLLPRVFPAELATPEPTALFHDDTSLENVLVGDDGIITGIVDWEYVSALPMWRICQVPAFLEGRERTEEPVWETYARETASETNLDFPAAALEVNGLYWTHLLEYEQTVLRKHFMAQMLEIEPQWMEEAEKGGLKADLEAAIYHCSTGSPFGLIHGWLDGVERGEVVSFRLQLRE